MGGEPGLAHIGVIAPSISPVGSGRPSGVLGRRHGFEVLRVAAQCVHAEVVDHETFRDRADQKLVGDPVSTPRGIDPVAALTKLPVATRPLAMTSVDVGASPLPAFIWVAHVDPPPEPLDVDL